MELSFHLITRSRRNFILFIFTGSEPPERGLTLVGLTLKVELRGTLRGGGALPQFILLILNTLIGK
jgi:hypothetical protein